MTFNPTDYQFWFKEYPMFNLWAINAGTLFLPKEFSEDDEFKKYDLTSKAYIFMKRLGQDYNRFLLMEEDERNKLFEMEMQLIKEQAKEANIKD